MGELHILSSANGVKTHKKEGGEVLYYRPADMWQKNSAKRQFKRSVSSFYSRKMKKAREYASLRDSGANLGLQTQTIEHQQHHTPTIQHSKPSLFSDFALKIPSVLSPQESKLELLSKNQLPGILSLPNEKTHSKMVQLPQIYWRDSLIEQPKPVNMDHLVNKFFLFQNNASCNIALK